ncbi:hypothetical protein [Streptomyces hydrogenans]
MTSRPARTLHSRAGLPILARRNRVEDDEQHWPISQILIKAYQQSTQRP